MLIVERRARSTPGDTIYIGDDIKVTILGVKGHDIVKVGVEAPRHLAVKRDDIKRDKPREV